MAKGTTAKATTPSVTLPTVTKGNIKTILASDGVNKTNSLLMVDPALLRVIPGYNARIHEVPSYQRDMEELKDSMRNEGFFIDQPIGAYVGKDGDTDVLYIVNGHRRYEAVMALIEEGLPFQSVPVVIKPEMDPVKMTVALVRENTGRRLTFFENSIVVRRLLKNGKSAADITQLLGFSEQAVRDFFLLIDAPKKIRDLVKLERVTGTEAVTRIKQAKQKGEGGGYDYDAAYAKLEKMIARAEEEKGPGAKATRKHSGDAPIKRATGKKKQREEIIEEGGDEPAEKAPETELTKITVKAAKGYKVHPVRWLVSEGAEFPIADIRHFKNLFGDTDWYKLDEDRPHVAIATETVEFVAYIIRPATKAKAEAEPAPTDEDEDEAETEYDDSEGETDEAEPIEDERQEELADL